MTLNDVIGDLLHEANMAHLTAVTNRQSAVQLPDIADWCNARAEMDEKFCERMIRLAQKYVRAFQGPELPSGSVEELVHRIDYYAAPVAATENAEPETVEAAR